MSSKVIHCFSSSSSFDFYKNDFYRSSFDIVCYVALFSESSLKVFHCSLHCNVIEMPLRGCLSLKTPPKEITNRGFLAIMGFLRRLEMGSVECKRTKLMLVGLGGAGKTRHVAF